MTFEFKPSHLNLFSAQMQERIDSIEIKTAI